MKPKDGEDETERRGGESEEIEEKTSKPLLSGFSLKHLELQIFSSLPPFTSQPHATPPKEPPTPCQPHKKKKPHNTPMDLKMDLYALAGVKKLDMSTPKPDDIQLQPKPHNDDDTGATNGQHLELKLVTQSDSTVRVVISPLK